MSEPLVRSWFCSYLVNAFTALFQSQQTQALIAQYPTLHQFFTYVWNTYIVGNFPAQLWNVFNRGMSERTNNVVESYHKRWNESVGVRHPSLWVAYRKLQDHQALSRNTLLRAINGYPPPPRRLKWRNLENNVNNLKVLLITGRRTVFAYWSAVSHFMENVR